MQGDKTAVSKIISTKQIASGLSRANSQGRDGRRDHEPVNTVREKVRWRKGMDGENREKLQLSEYKCRVYISEERQKRRATTHIYIRRRHGMLLEAFICMRGRR